MSKIVQIKITLRNISPPVWRRVLLETSSTFADLHQIIQCVMGWENYHLHSFSILNEDYESNYDDSDLFQEDKNEHKYTIQKILSLGVQKFQYTYDFGDDWTHNIQIEKILSMDSSIQYPICIKGKRACPPEDVGGSCGYIGMLETLNGPNTPEKNDLLEWLGGPFDAEAFNLDESNRSLHG